MTTMNPYKLLRSSWSASLLGLAALGLVAGPAHAATLTWGTSGTGGAGTWTATDGWWNGTTQQTWSNDTPDDAIFGGTGGAVTLAGGTTTAGGITFNAFTGSYTIGTASQALTINGGGITMNSGAGTVTFQNSPITLGAAQSWTNNSSSLLTVSSGITNGGNLLTVDGSGNTTVSGAVSGTGGLTKVGAGTLTLSASNTYSGTTTVNGGLITTGSNPTGSVRVSSFGTGPIAIGASGTVRLTGYNGLPITSPFTGAFGPGYTNTVSGSGTLELVGQHTDRSVNYSGDLSGFTGTVSATAAANTLVGLGNGRGSVTNFNMTGSNAKFVVSGAGRFIGVLSTSDTIAMGELSGDGRIETDYLYDTTWEIGALSTSSTFSGGIFNNQKLSSLRKVGSGTLTLTGSNAYTGATTIVAGRLALEGNGVLNSGSYAGAIANAGELVMGSDVNQIVSGVISGTGSLLKSGSGTLTLSAVNSYSGTTTVNGGLITTGSNTTNGNVRVSSFGTGPIAIGASGTVRLTGWNGGAASSTPAYYASGYTNTVSGSGTLELVGQSSNYSVNYSGDLSNFTGTVSATAASGLYVGFGGGSTTSPVNLSGSNARFVINGAGTFTPVFGSTARTGTIAMGELSGNGNIDSGLNNNTTYVIGALSTSSTFSGIFSGTTSITKVGSGTLTLTGSSTYTGGTQLNGGVLALGSANAISTSGTISFGGGTLQFSASNTTDYSSRFSTAAGQAYSLDTNGQNVTVGTALSSSGGSLTKSGLGILTLWAANAYAGDTIIKGGTLKLASGGSFDSSPRIIVGDATSSNAILDLTDKTGFSIGSAQTLLGKGTVLLSATTNLTVAGLFSPGNSPDLFTYNSGSTTLSGTTLMEIWGTSRGATYDAVNVINSGLLTLGGMLELNFDQNFLETDSFLLFDTLTSGSLAGGFTGITITGSNNTYVGLSFTQAGNVWTTGFNGNNQGLRVTQTASNVTLDVIVVPEPGAAALAGCGVALAGWMAARRRRRR